MIRVWNDHFLMNSQPVFWLNSYMHAQKCVLCTKNGFSCLQMRTYDMLKKGFFMKACLKKNLIQVSCFLFICKH